MLVVFQFLAVLCCILFAGAAIYINLVEHPARMGCDTKTAATVWAPSYKRATVMQAPLAVISFLAGVVAWLLGGGLLWLIGAVLIGLVVPFTFIAVMPTNHQLLAPGRDLSSVETRSLLEKWGRLHAVRSALSFLASIMYLVSIFGG
jgi:Anthrone oxygenase